MSQRQTQATEASSSDKDYPNPPWRLGGQQWAALFKTDRPVQMSDAVLLGAKPIFSHRLGVALLHYTSGTLSYDELIVSVPVRIGWLPCLWIRDIWVSDVRAQLGGIHIWNLPKQIARFDWDGDNVTVEDDDGLVAKLHVRCVRTHWPWAISVLSIAGSRNGSWKTATAIWRGRVSLAKPVVEAWSERFDERLVVGKGFGFSSSRFQMTVKDAKQR
ncbi:MAG: hypothetical protein HKN47_02705 [Pirellulaceae bacterium]|nr:hypothetical protein [Pirellulaceae bacterium]